MNKTNYALMTALACLVAVAWAGGSAAQVNRLPSKFGSQSSAAVRPTVAGQEQPSGGAAEEVLPPGMTRLNYIDMDLKQLVDIIRNLLPDKKFILSDRNLSGKKITIISESPIKIETAYEAFLSALEINGLTIVETPGGFYNIVPKKETLTKPTDLFKDGQPVTDNYGNVTDKFITRIVPLTNISVKDLNDIVDKLRSPEGRVLPSSTTNSLIITDTGANINHILKIIKELDKEGPQEQIHIIPIINADAKDIAQKITQIFETEGDSANNAVARRQIFRRGPQAEIEEVQAISKVIPDERTNAIIIKGTNRSIDKVRELISRLDRTIEGIEGSIHVYYLKHANAKEIAEVLNNLASGATQRTGTAAGGAAARTGAATTAAARTAAQTGAVELEGGVKVTADEGTNALVITASPKDFTTLVDKVISKLDIVRPQVYLEAVIMSLDVRKSTTIGISANGGLINTTGGGNQFTSFGSLLPVAPTAISSLAGASGGLGTGIISSQTIDFTLADGSTVSIPAVSAILQALQSDTDANVLSTPSILTMDNEEAQIQVGQEVPVPSGTTVGTGVTTFNVTREPVGIILKIKPQISESDTVRLNIEQEISSVFGSDPSLGPTIDTKLVKTVVVAQNKQTIVIGGLIDDKASVATQKVPLIGDIPVLGNLFKNRQSTKTKTNLIVFITPYIIKERADYMAILKKKIEERNAFIDMNYGTGQKKSIRQAIQNHAMDLLEFKCQMSDLGDPCAAGYGATGYAPLAPAASIVAEQDIGNEYDPKKRRGR